MKGVFSHSGRPAHLDYDGPQHRAKAMERHAAATEKAAIVRECAELRIAVLRYMASSSRTQIAIAELAGVAYTILGRLLAGGVITPESRKRIRTFLSLT